MKQLSALCFVMLFFSSLASQAVAENTTRQGYQAWLEKRQGRYDDYRFRYLKRYNQFRAKLAETWGLPELSSNSSYVRYKKDLSVKTVLDYSKNEIRFSMLEDQSAPKPFDLRGELNKLSTESLADTAKADGLIESMGKNADSLLESIVGQKVNLGELLSRVNTEVKALEFDLNAENNALDVLSKEFERIAAAPPALASIKNVALTDEQAPQPTLTPALLKLKAASQKQLKAAFSKARNRAEVSQKQVRTFVIKLPGHASFERAKQYKMPISDQARYFDQDPALLFAIAQTESSFNPLATSPIPAYGLMQVVPRSAGIDVNSFLNGQRKPPTPSQLYQPITNLKFGSTYLHLLSDEYLGGIKDPLSRVYCVIAAYNTGPGNVASVFHPQRRKALQGAVNAINKLSAEQVYRKLVQELPYEETRVYLQKVLKAQRQFETEFSKGWLQAAI